MSVLSCPIPKEAWVPELGKRNGTAALTSTLRTGTTADRAGAWEACVQEILQLQQLEDDWDGFGAKAPARDLIESAVGLAHLFRDRDVPAPSRVVAGVDGAVLFEWQLPDGTYADVEIVRPFFAEVMLIEPGQPAKHWTLPTE